MPLAVKGSWVQIPSGPLNMSAYCKYLSPIAQQVEQLAVNQCVVGSNPTGRV